MGSSLGIYTCDDFVVHLSSAVPVLMVRVVGGVNMPLTVKWGSLENEPLVAQMVRNMTAKQEMQETRDPWVGKIPWRREWQSTPVFLPGEFHGQRSLAGYSPWGCKE